MRVAVWLVLVAGCDDLWNLEYVEPGARSPDAAPDSRSFDPATDCPPDYDLALFAGSRYRVTLDSLAAWDSEGDCADDSDPDGSGDAITHLAVAETRDELAALHASMIAKSIDIWWVGAVQPASGVATPDDGWIWVTGLPIAEEMWAGPIEPNDGDGTETDHAEQFADIWMSVDGLLDIGGAQGQRAVCECDGKRVSEDARTAIDQAKH